MEKLIELIKEADMKDSYVSIVIHDKQDVDNSDTKTSMIIKERNVENNINYLKENVGKWS